MRYPAVNVVITINVVVAALLIIALALALRIVEQYEAGVMFRLGRIVQVKNPALPRSSRSPTGCARSL